MNIIGDKQVGYGDMDIFSNPCVFTKDEFMGAPPNILRGSQGQDWDFSFIPYEKLFNKDGSLANGGKFLKKTMKKAFIFEGEKSCLLYASYFGIDNDISVACCGSSLIAYQVKLLLDLGVEEIIIGFDKQFQEFNDEEHKKLVKNLKNIHKKYGMFVNISYMFDKWDLLDYKSSPIDHGKETFLELFKRRVTI